MEFSCLPGVTELESTEGPKSPARFKKELLRAGVYTHPQDPQLRLAVSPERMAQWVEGFKQAPFKVYVPLRHTKDPAQNAGWVEELLLEGDKLYGILCITDEGIAQKIREGTIQDVSIAVEKDVTDAEGNTYEELITHVALTLDPHFREQEPFLELEGAGSAECGMRNAECGIKNISHHSQLLEEEIQGYLAAGKITPACVPYLRPLLSASSPQIHLESDAGAIHEWSLQFGEALRAFLAALPAAVDYRELGQVELGGPPGRLSVKRAEKEAKRILKQ